MLRQAYAFSALCFCLMASISAFADTKNITVIYDEKPTALSAMINESKHI